MHTRRDLEFIKDELPERTEDDDAYGFQVTPTTWFSVVQGMCMINASFLASLLNRDSEILSGVKNAEEPKDGNFASFRALCFIFFDPFLP